MYFGIVERLSKLRGVGGPGTRIGLEVVLTPRPAFDWRGGTFWGVPGGRQAEREFESCRLTVRDERPGFLGIGT